MKRTSYTRIILGALVPLVWACGQPDGGGTGPSSSGSNGAVSSTGTGSSAASCDDECRDYYDCEYSLCLVREGSSCATQRIAGYETCDRLTQDDCTAELLSDYASCGGSDPDGDGSSDGGYGDASSSGWAESSSDGGSSGWGDGSSDTGCLPSNSFCDFDAECCSGECDDDFAFCH